jgi:hypothetical protein
MKQQNPKVLKLGEVYPGRVQFVDGNCGRVIDPYGREHFFHRDRYLKVKVRDGSVTFCSRKESGKLPSPQPCTWVYFMLGKDGQGRIRVHKF